MKFWETLKMKENNKTVKKVMILFACMFAAICALNLAFSSTTAKSKDGYYTCAKNSGALVNTYDVKSFAERDEVQFIFGAGDEVQIADSALFGNSKAVITSRNVRYNMKDGKYYDTYWAKTSDNKVFLLSRDSICTK